MWLIDNKKYYSCELSQWFNLEDELKTNDVNDVKEVMKKQLENVPKRKEAGKKNANDVNDRTNTTNVD